ncbi:MAG TPA: HEAT repeat domain-containing protein [Chryseolinea sp.]|nr:HEAT repeat domain-containing protein [Chryseolinea sp.]HPH46601.1 HEAT repeat domain-containing protein [Chryseolinea sp.]HPM30121.1 HEAT repeat domain-containing protein [Chryseolinea sp.]
MEKGKIEDLLIDYIDGKLTEADRLLVEKELLINEKTYKLYDQLKEVMQLMNQSSTLQPSAKLKADFDSFLKSESKPVKETKTIFFQPSFYRVAAAVALLIVGGGVVFTISNEYAKQQAELKAMQKEVKETKLMLMAMLDNQQSASQRVLGANVAYKMERTDDEIVRALVKAMNEDENSNVRLAALDALRKFYHQDHVRKTLIASMATQKDPIVQIALIRLLAEMKEKEIVRELQRITTDEEELPAVKDEAHAALHQLV